MMKRIVLLLVIELSFAALYAQTKIIAHRGYRTSVYYPEIDLSSFKKDKETYIIRFDGASLNGWRSYGLQNESFGLGFLLIN